MVSLKVAALGMVAIVFSSMCGQDHAAGDKASANTTCHRVEKCSVHTVSHKAPLQFIPVVSYDTSGRTLITIGTVNVSGKEVACWKYWDDASYTPWYWQLHDMKTGKPFRGAGFYIALDACRRKPIKEDFVTLSPGEVGFRATPIAFHKKDIAPGRYELRIHYKVEKGSDFDKFGCAIGNVEQTILVFDIDK